MTDDITLRAPGPDEIRAFSDPLAVAFSEEFAPGELDSYGALFELDRAINAFDGEQRVGAGGAYTFRLTAPGGGEVGAAGITAIGVIPSHRRRGILRRIMAWLHDQALDRGEAVAVLWASEGAIYQRFGYGFGTLGSIFEADRARVAFREPVRVDGARIRIVDIDEGVRVFPTIYEEVRRMTPGSLTRTPVKWREQVLTDAEWARGGNGPKYLALLEVDGQPRAYAVYRVKADWDERGPKGTLLVLELMSVDPEAEQTLWQWLFSMDLVGVVKAWRGPVPHPLQQWLVEPRRLGLIVGDGMWLRLLDVPAALEARGYSGSGALVLEVTDGLIAANGGRWQLSVPSSDRGGGVSVERTSAEPDLVLDVAALACVYLGALRFSDLARAGRVRECRPGALVTADVLFTADRAPWCSTVF
jgi:predicted acetyltransferase